MAEPIQEVFWLTSADRQQLLYVSPAFETVWGHPLESLYNYPGGYVNLIVDSIHPSDRERFVAALTKQVQNEYKTEYRIVRPDGSMRWVRWRSYLVQNQFGESWAIAGLSEDITKYKQAEEILHQRQQEFRALVELSPDIISRFDRELRHVYVNPVIELATGMTPQEFIGKTHRELGMPQELRALWEQSIQKVFQTGEPDEHEFSYMTPQGGKYYQSRLFPEFAADGSVESVLGICRDLTKNKQMEEALRESEERFRTVFEFAPIGIALTNTQGELFACNRAFEEIIGYTQEELQNQPFIQFTHPDDRAEDFALFQEMLAGKRTRVSREKHFCRKDGCIVWGKVSVSAVYDAKGAPNYAIAMVQDITAQKQAQLELQNAHDELEKRVAERTAELAQANLLLQQEIAERKLAQEALSLSEERFRLAIDNIPNVFVIYDAQRRIQFVNHPGLRTSGKSLEEHLGKTDEEIWPHEVTKNYLPMLKQTVETRTTQTGECNITLPHTGIFTIIVCYVPLLNEEGEIYQILGITHDITERKQAETQIKESLQEKEVLLQEIHHRVKNNLQVVSSLLDLQSQHIDDPAMLEIFRESCNRVRSMALIHEQLYQSKDCAKINFSKYIEELTNYLFRVYDVNVGQITLELDIEEVTLNINTAIPCSLIISELVSNALKHAFPHGNGGEIKIALHSDSANQLSLIVKDNGIGFSNSDLKTVKSLGLQLVNVLTNQLEGILELDGRLGTQFKITFSEVSP